MTTRDVSCNALIAYSFRLIDFTQAKDAQLENLFKACEAATFGLEHKDVLDESYRKAGKMDVDRFAMHFSPDNLGIVSVVSDFLLRGRTGQKTINTPRSSSMIGSLVVVLPTSHEGGSLILRDAGKEWSFDSAQAVKSGSTSSAAFVAFFSDVEHEVTTVTSGYRVTLTYNLYLKDAPNTSISVQVSAYDKVESQIKEALAAHLKDPAFLPKGGAFGFGLAHRYPFNPNTTELEDIEEYLKGTDAAIKRACDSLSLTTAIKAVYRDDRYDDAVLLNSFAQIGTDEIEGGIAEYLMGFPGTKVIYNAGKKRPSGRGHFDGHFDMKSRSIPIAWAKPLEKVNGFRSSYIHYGNSASLTYAYGEVCLVALVDSAKERIK